MLLIGLFVRNSQAKVINNERLSPSTSVTVITTTRNAIQKHFVIRDKHYRINKIYTAVCKNKILIE